MVLWFGVVIIVMVTITRFMFICVWKSMRTMNDDLIVRIAVNQALLSSIVYTYLVHTYLHTYRSMVSWDFLLKVRELTPSYGKFTFSF